MSIGCCILLCTNSLYYNFKFLDAAKETTEKDEQDDVMGPADEVRAATNETVVGQKLLHIIFND